MKKLILSFGALAIILSSCGGGNETPSNVEHEHQEHANQPESPAAATETIVQLASNDQMKYDKAEIKVKAGLPVKLTLTHTGTMAKTVMGHNFVLLAQGVVPAEFATSAIAAGPDNNYIPAESSEVLAHTKVIGGGESVTITFDAPAPGTYDFICSFPGHYAMMNGKFIVE